MPMKMAESWDFWLFTSDLSSLFLFHQPLLFFVHSSFFAIMSFVSLSFITNIPRTSFFAKKERK